MGGNGFSLLAAKALNILSWWLTGELCLVNMGGVNLKREAKQGE
jgi:hypothetical protein